MTLESFVYPRNLVARPGTLGNARNSLSDLTLSHLYHCSLFLARDGAVAQLGSLAKEFLPWSASQPVKTSPLP